MINSLLFILFLFPQILNILLTSLRQCIVIRLKILAFEGGGKLEALKIFNIFLFDKRVLFCKKIIDLQTKIM